MTATLVYYLFVSLVLIIIGFIIYKLFKVISFSQSNKDIEELYLKAVSVQKKDRGYFFKKLDEIKNQTIEKVIYVQYNYQNRKSVFKDFHLVDQAVFIILSNGKGISWIFDSDEEGFHSYHLFLEDFRIGFRELVRIDVSERKRNGALWNEMEPQWIDVSDSKGWFGLLGKKLNNVRFLMTTHKNKDYISDVILEIEGKTVHLSSTEEPEPTLLPKLSGIPYATEWTVVTFSKNLINLHGRKGL